MKAIVKNILLTTFILSIFRESCESYNLSHTIPAKYDNKTDVVRLRRQNPVHSCKGDVLKFQCATTSDCISAELECDGEEDCPDGSDEKESLCKDFPKKCTTPAKPEYGKWINLNNGSNGYFSSQINEHSVIKYSCNPGYKLSTTVEDVLLVHCLPNGEWSAPVLPVCQRLCQSLYSSPLITVSCKNDGSSVRCDKATDNTIVTYKCAPHYEAPYGRPRSSTCYNGSWDYTPDCIPVCGEKIVSATPLIVNGQKVERGHYPWVVALYSRKDSDPYFKNICGGSLITTDIVLTAAHCVSQKETGNIYDAKYFRVGAGKYYNLYEDPRDADTAQHAEVALIEAHREYKGEIQNFRADIALLKLKTNLVLSQVVQPVCYNILPIIEPNTVGLVTGWGYTISSGEPSETLKELELPYNADEQCLKDLDKDFSNRYFTSDKLCAGFNDQNTSVCNGDSGGGLVFRNPSFKKRYFIHGIVSLAHSYRENQKTHCNIQQSALFTKVENYVEWIQLKVRQWAICCPDLPVTGDSGAMIAPLIKTHIKIKRKSERICETSYTDYNIKYFHNDIKNANASIGQFPHAAVLGFENTDGEIQWNCGASLISTRFLLTAARCFVCTGCNDPKVARLGTVDFTDSKSAQDIDVKNVISHPEYSPEPKSNDIGIVELVKDVLPSNLVYPACLYTKADDPIELQLLGSLHWGIAKGSLHWDFLHYATIQPLTLKECKKPFGLFLPEVFDKTQICALNDACSGPAGHPVQLHNEKGGYDIVGIMSSGWGCRGGVLPEMYTRVASYLDWIEAIVWPDLIMN